MFTYVQVGVGACVLCMYGVLGGGGLMSACGLKGERLDDNQSRSSLMSGVIKTMGVVP